VIGDQLRISVTDTGIGIELDKQALIFDSFEQLGKDADRAFGGTGLGLAICKQLVTLHGGQIEVDSQPSAQSNGQSKGGSVFSFTLPTCDQVPQSNEAALQTIARLQPLPQNVTIELLSDEEAEQHYLESKLARSNQDNHRFRLLLVDDEPVNLQVLHDHLSLQNYQLVQASSGQQALTLLKDEPFDLVLLDVMMPQMSGFEVCQQLREIHSCNDLPVIFLTANNQVSDLVHSFAVGANDYLTKPVAKHELLARVETHLKLLDVNRNLELRVSQRTQQLIQAEKMASLGTLTGGFAHEINNPNNFVSVSAQNLQVDLDKLEKVIFKLAGDDTDEAVLNHLKAHFSPLHQHLSTIGIGADRIKNIVRDLQTFTHQGSGDLNLVSITQNLQSTINLIKTKHLKVVEFATDFVDHPDLLCYPSQLNQVFMQLMLNGCDAIFTKQQQNAEHAPSDDYMKKPGLIVIACRLVNGNIEIVFTDNGCGMEQAVINKLFDPFYTTKDVGQGTGLGLSITYNIVRQHQGELSFSSTPGVGTICTLVLPQITQ
ncbi:MAG: ATP-binding protein, partial [Psychrosphaera sp.]|nr:ATP-binding protein [Psychrosphaera sp.]